MTTEPRQLRSLSCGRPDSPEDVLKQAERCQQEAEDLNTKYLGHFVDNFTNQNFLERISGSKFMLLRPGDYFLAWKFHHVFNSADECFNVFRLADAAQITFVVLASPLLRNRLSDAALRKASESAYRQHQEYVYRKKGISIPSFGWRRVSDGDAPDFDVRDKAMKMVEMMDAGMSFKEIAEKCTQDNLWGKRIDSTMARNMIDRARDGFPGADGAFETSSEGRGY